MIKIIFALVLLFSIPAIAEDKSDVRAHEIEGKQFVCFTPEDAKVLLQMRLDLPKLKDEIAHLTELANIRDTEINVILGLNSNLVKQNETYKEETVRLQQELETQNVWYKSPYLWFCAGIIVGTGMTIGVFQAVK